MNSAELQAMRRLLFFSAAEAARYLAADEERPQGVEERTWNRWEAGKLPVPSNVAATVLLAMQMRQAAIEEWRRAVGLVGRGYVTAIWYAEGDDWPQARQLWRPDQSAKAAALAEHGDRVRLVLFDALAFQRWRAAEGVADTSETRGLWAAGLSPLADTLHRG